LRFPFSIRRRRCITNFFEVRRRVRGLIPQIIASILESFIIVTTSEYPTNIELLQIVPVNFECDLSFHLKKANFSGLEDRLQFASSQLEVILVALQMAF
jgi:hypothetical protein